MVEYFLFSDTTDYRTPAIFSKTALIKKLRRMGSSSTWGNLYSCHIYDKNGEEVEWLGANKFGPGYDIYPDEVIEEHKREFEEAMAERKAYLARLRGHNYFFKKYSKR